MGKSTSIGWCDHTFNPWWGCVRKSPGCEKCYAETFAVRTGHAVWGPAKTTPRRKLSESYWKGPEKWNREAEQAGERRRVFCASMADVFEEHPDVVEERERLWSLIEATPALDWLLLTKRPENMVRMAPERWADGWPWNVWAGTSVEDQLRAEERVPLLLRVPATIRFLSCEPLIGPVRMAEAGFPWATGKLNVRTGERERIQWAIIGGESGPGARPMDLRWARALLAECRQARVAPFVKQLGARPVAPTGHLVAGDGRAHIAPLRLHDAKGEDWNEWPDDLRVREWPRTREARPVQQELFGGPAA